MKKGIPRKFPVLGMVYQVKHVKGFTNKTGLGGLCDASARVITLDSTLTGDELIDTFIHEIVHAFQFESGLAEILDRQALEMNAQSLRAFLRSTFTLKFKSFVFTSKKN